MNTYQAIIVALSCLASVTSAHALTCAASLTRMGNQLEISGLVTGSEAVDGTYNLVVVSRQGTNSATSVQQGSFSKLASQHEIILGKSTLYAQPGMRVDATLTISVSGASPNCQNLEYYFDQEQVQPSPDEAEDAIEL